jgi:serine/threonine protein kinase
MTTRIEALVGTTLDDRYRIDALLGQGGMGAVFKATHVGLHREVAIKVLHPEIGSDGQIAKRFEREAHSASRLDHPHCVRVTDFGATADGMKYLVMELLSGCELTKKLGKPWPWAEAIVVVEQVLEALVHAHQNGIVHRDLKPENVFLTTDFKGQEIAKIVDFGIAKLLDSQGSKEALTRAGMVFGTPRYMSPEQAAGGKVDERTDLYALGIIFYEMLAGDAPFDAEELPMLLRMQIMAPPPPLPEHVPSELVAFVGKLLEKSRHDRYESAAVALAELRKIADKLGQQSASTMPPMGDGIPSAIPADARSLVGTVLAERYQLDAMLGEGGMGAVFRARHLLMDRNVAVKILHPELGRDPEISARFDREAQTAARLEHPNIVSVLEFGGTPAGFRYLVMPLLAGAELRTMTGRAMPPDRAIALAIQLFAALEHAHARAVVHRDLKPENVFVVRDEQGREQLKLVDFGLAKLAEGASTGPALTRIGQVFGTPAYMSPEQALGETVDARTDIYSAGLILYELLAGRLPFVDDDLVKLLQKQVHEPPPPLPDSIDSRLRDLVMALLAKNREQRIPDATTAKRMLQSLQSSSGSISLGSMATMADLGSRSTMASMPSMSSMPSMASMAPPSPALLWLKSIPRRWLQVGAGVLGLLVIIAAWPESCGEDESEPDDPESSTVEPKVADSGKPPPIRMPFGNKPDEAVYIEIDRLLSAKSKDSALERIKLARDEFPEDAGLLWREGRALALSKDKVDRQTALERYGEAVDADPTLVEQAAFHSELYGLLGEPALRDSAIDLAVQKLGSPAHAFLLEQVNVEDPKQALGWVDRHRIIDALTEKPESLARVDMQLNLARDLYQAEDAPQPCTSFGKTLDAIEERNEPYFVEHTTSQAVTIPIVPGTGEDISACDGLAERYAALGAKLSAAYPEEAERVEKARKNRKKGGGGGGGGGGFWPW